MKIYRIAQQGEWWIIGNQAIFADSDTGDIGHEAYVIEMVKSEIASDLFYNGDLDYSWDEVKQNIIRNMIQIGNLDEDYMIKIYGEDYIDKMPYDTDIFDSVAIENGVDKLKLDVADKAVDARDYGMKVLGWKRVEGSHVQTQTFTSEDLKSISSGLWDAYESELEYNNEMPFTIEVRSTNKTYWHVPYSVIETDNPLEVARFGGKGAYQYAKNLNTRWVKK